MTYGPLMMDLVGLEMSPLERQQLLHPLVGGVILFSRNYRDRQQLTALCHEIHALRTPRLLIAVDHEGGRVQRFRDGFSALPAPRTLGTLWDSEPQAALQQAYQHGYVLASELRACGVDFSFTPVLDLDWGRSSVIGNRALHAEPQAVIQLAASLIEGLAAAGMASCGKHFPGHGWVEADSHIAMPEDERSLEEMAADIQPYRQLKLAAVMPAHVIYPRIDSQPAGFSRVWIEMLRQQLKFDGVIFSDDLSMQAASVAGVVLDRVQAAWQAGCDMLLLCNSPEDVATVLDQWQPQPAVDAAQSARIAALLPRSDSV